MKRKKYSKQLKSKVALSAIKAQNTNGAIASEFGVHTGMVSRWKKQAIEALSSIFGDNQSKTIQTMEKERDLLFQQIGKLQVELDWLKKNTGHLM